MLGLLGGTRGRRAARRLTLSDTLNDAKWAGDRGGSGSWSGHPISEPTSADPRWSLGEAIAHASRSERLYAGEFFGSGTLPGGSGIETGRLLSAGDLIEIGIDRIGTLTNRIVAREEAP